MSSSPTPSDDLSTRQQSIEKGATYTESGFHEVPSLENTVWRKFDWRILPVASMFYFLSFLDRSNIANARVAGMQEHLKITNYQYSIALTVTFVPYIAAELPSNLMLKYVGPDRMLPTMVALWGVVTTMQGFIHNYQGLLACRFFLGLLEGGLFPGLVLYLSGFYPRRYLQSRITIFFAAATLSGAFSGLLAAAIVKMDGTRGRPGWSWIFILEGTFTIAYGLVAFFLTLRSPSDARFFTDKEREYVLERLRDDGVVAHDSDGDQFSWIEVGRAFMSPQVCFIAIISFMTGTLIFALAYFEPTIVAGLGHYSHTRVQLLSVPPFAVAFVLTMISAVISDRYGVRGLTMIFFSLMSLAGFALFYHTESKSVKYASLFLSLPGSYGLAPTMSTWNANNTAPHVRRATAVAIAFIMSNSGGILSTWLMGALSPGPKYTKATTVFIVFSVGILITSAANLVYLKMQNIKKEQIRAAIVERKHEQQGLGDKSAWFIYNL